MDTYWFDKLLSLLMVQSNSENEKLMVLYLDKELKKLKLTYQIDPAGNILVVKCKSVKPLKTYPCVVSHMDTVHNFVDNFKLYQDKDDNDILFAMSNGQRVGIGGDDKCGIFACLYLLKVMPQIKVVFFSREENGCKGSTAINKEFFADCRYLIQLDRRGNRDFIQTYWGEKTISHEFSSEIGIVKKKYKYKNMVGTVTDVMKLWKNKVGISCINLSCGYYQPHSKYEYISIDDLWHSTKFTEEIINTMKPKRYISLPPKAIAVKTSYIINTYTKTPSIYSQCSVCKKWKRDALLYEVQGGSKKQAKHGKKKICWPCKKELMESNKTDFSILPNNKVIIFACNECGIKTDEMTAGDSLRYVNGDLYCSGCAALVEIPKSWSEPVTEATPEKCYVCNNIIPKDHKIIKRFGTRVCEDCATQSDEEVLS